MRRLPWMGAVMALWMASMVAQLWLGAGSALLPVVHSHTTPSRGFPSASSPSPFPLNPPAVPLLWVASTPPLSAPPSPPTPHPTPCDFTFSALDAVYFLNDNYHNPHNYSLPLIQYQPIAATCPPHCIGGNSSLSPTVFGSYPYHSSSSICLAAIHSGLINATQGGGVFVSRFYRQDWTGTDTQTIFPFTSAVASLSNGVQSGEVDRGWYSVPSNGSEWSYVVRGRGEVVVQRREAPFPHRAGHLHQWWQLVPQDRLTLNPDLLDAIFPNPYNRTYSIHLIMGGYNATHYLNDVWMAVQREDWVYEDMEWRQLADAPFSPRADMQGRWHKLGGGPGSFGLPLTRRESAILFIVGGQTNHSCGLRELGQCSSEVWQVNITLAIEHGADPRYEFGLAWGNVSAELPFPSRCGAALVTRRHPSPRYDPDYIDHFQQMIVIGGQLSYSDPTCSTNPTTVSEMWAVNLHLGHSQVLNFTHLANAPFSSRRFDPSNMDEAVRQNQWIWEYQPMQALMGGLRHVTIQRDEVGGRKGNGAGDSVTARLTGTEVYADVWFCSFDLREGAIDAQKPPQSCLWASGVSPTVGGKSWSNIPLPSFSLAVPAAGGAFAMSTTFTRPPFIGGFSSRADLDRWQNTRPYLQEDAVVEDGIQVDWSEVLGNVSAVYHPTYYWSERYAPTATQPNSTAWWQSMLAELRLRLPTTAFLHEAELNSPDSDYVLGSDYLHSSQIPESYLARWNGEVELRRSQLYTASTLQHQPYALTTHPNRSTWFLPQAVSSLNTSRPLFNFRLRRLHAQSVIAPLVSGTFSPQTEAINAGMEGTASVGLSVSVMTFLSGGHSGLNFTSDWLVLHTARCLPPTDPSFRAALGPVRYAPFTYKRDRNEISREEWQGMAGSFGVGDVVTVACMPGYHFEPALMDAEADMKCTANAMWMDYTAFTIRRCVKNRLNCTAPLADVGGVYCEPMLPLISGMEASYVYNGTLHRVVADDAVVLTGLPYQAGVQLTVRGNAFFPPLEMSVGPFNCSSISLCASDGSTDLLSVTYNISLSPSNTSLIRSPYGAMIVCELPMMMGLHMPVTIFSSLVRERVEVDVNISSSLPLLSSILPRVVSTSINRISPNSTDPGVFCNETDLPMNYVNCPPTQPTSISLCVADNSLDVHSNPVELSFGHGLGRLVEAQELFNQRPLTVCYLAILPPQRGTFIPLHVRTFMLDYAEWDTAGASLAAVQSQSLVTFSFSSCPAGSTDDPAKAFAGDSFTICSACEPGYSTQNSDSTHSTCQPCRPGTYADNNQTAVCALCDKGTYAGDSGAVQCTPCPLNSYQNATGQTRCDECDLNQYIVYATGSSARQSVAGECKACPELATCSREGNITAAAGQYLLIDQQQGTLSSVLCSYAACTAAEGAGGTTTATTAAQLVAHSGLHVVNMCAAGRWPAYVADAAVYADVSALQDTAGHNVLCSLCLPGNAQVNGRCISCSSTHYAALLGVLLLALLLVYLVHRMPHDWTGSATLLISMYFLQQAALFLANESMPQLLSMLNISLLGDHTTRGSASDGESGAADTGSDSPGFAGYCVVPLSDTGRVVMTLLSPVVAFTMLAAIGGMQWLMSRALRSSPRLSSSARARAAYRWLFASSSEGSSSFDSSHGAAAAGMRHAQAELSTSLLSDAPEQLSSSSSSTAPVSPEDERDPLHALSTRGRYQRTIVRMVQLSYTGLSVQCLSFFHQQSVGQFGWRLVDYPSVSPSSSEYMQLLPAIVAVLVVVVVGLPVLLTVFLVVQYRAGAIEQVKARQMQPIVSASAAAGQAGQLEMHSRAHTLLLQLLAMYRVQCWWMPPFILVRRLLLVSVLVTSVSSSVWVWLTLVNWCLLMLHLHLQPYERRRDNSLETLTLLSLCLQTTLLTVYPPPYMSRGLFAVFNALIIVPLVPAVVGKVVDVRKKWALRSSTCAGRVGSVGDWSDGLGVEGRDSNEKDWRLP